MKSIRRSTRYVLPLCVYSKLEAGTGSTRTQKLLTLNFRHEKEINYVGEILQMDSECFEK
jgi:hypothetical protein